MLKSLILSTLMSFFALSCKSELSIRVDNRRDDSNKASIDTQVLETKAGKIPYCSSEGELNCVSTKAFPAVATENIGKNLLIGKTLLGIQGEAQLPDLVACEAEGQIACYVQSEFKAAKVDGLAAKVIIPEVVAGISGLVNNNPDSCSVDGASNCYASANEFVQLDRAHYSASDVLLGKTLGGLVGTLRERPLDCSADGQISCVSTSAYPVVEKARITNNLDVIFHSLPLLGGTIQGTLDECSLDGGTACLADGVVTKAADLSAFSTADLRAGVTAAGLLGVADSNPGNCSNDGGTGCTTGSNFPAVDMVNSINPIRAYYQTNLRLAGAYGSMDNCSSDNAASCFAIAAYPAVDKNTKITSQLGNILSSLTVAGTVGTLSSCSADGSSACIPDGSTTKAALLSGFSSHDISQGQTMAGVSGDMVLIPGNCSSNAQTGCIAASNYPALDKFGHLDAQKAKIRSSLTIQSIAGTIANCSADAASGCYAVSAFPSLDLASLTAKKSMLRNSYNIAGVDGDLPNCSANGQADCMAVSTSYKAQNPNDLTAASIRSGTTILGIAGSLSNCSSAGEQSCYATGSFYSAPACASDGGQSCYATGSYLAATACSANGSSCYIPNYAASVQPLKAIDYDQIDPDMIKAGYSIAGKAGTYPSASNPLSGSDGTDDLTDTNFLAKLTTASSFAWFDKAGVRRTAGGSSDIVASNLRKNTDIFGVLGTIGMPLAHDVRIDTVGASSTGAMKVNCRNTTKLSFYNYDGALSSITNGSSTVSSSNADIWDTTDDYTYSTANSTIEFPSAWSSSLYKCDASDWEDLTSQSKCSGVSKCMRDKISGLIWSTRTGDISWPAAVTYCYNLGAGGGTWRLPTIKEFFEAYAQGLAYLNISNFPRSGTHHYWTSTTSASNTTQAWIMGSGNGFTEQVNKTDARNVTCVR